MTRSKASAGAEREGDAPRVGGNEPEREQLRRLAMAVQGAASGPAVAASALAALEALVAMPAALIDRFEAGGRRFLLAVEDAAADRAGDWSLSSREKRVLGRRARGQALKNIAFDLNVSLATVSRDLASGTRKLRVGTPRELPLVAAVDELE